jgi:hypothetical protein
MISRKDSLVIIGIVFFSILVIISIICFGMDILLYSYVPISLPKVVITCTIAGFLFGMIISALISHILQKT